MPFNPVSFIMARVKFIQDAMKHKDMLAGKRKRGKEVIYVRWIAPRMDWVMLNTDGASKGNPDVVRCGGLIRGHMGVLFGVFAARCGLCSSTKVELLGVLRGLAVAWNAEHKKVQLTLDSELVVKLLTNPIVLSSPFFSHHS